VAAKTQMKREAYFPLFYTKLFYCNRYLITFAICYTAGTEYAENNFLLPVDQTLLTALLHSLTIGYDT
jgi:hypothetical protein